MAKKSEVVTVETSEEVQVSEKKNTRKKVFVDGISDESLRELVCGLALSDEAFKEKYGFVRTTVPSVFDDLAETYPVERVRSLFVGGNNENVYVTGKRIENAKEIRCKISPEIYAEYRELMEGYKDTMKPEILSELLRRAIEPLLARKRAGEKILRIPAVAEQEL